MPYIGIEPKTPTPHRISVGEDMYTGISKITLCGIHTESTEFVFKKLTPNESTPQ